MTGVNSVNGYNLFGAGRFYYSAGAYGNGRGSSQPVEPVSPVPPVDAAARRSNLPLTAASAANSARMPAPQLPEIREGADPVEMAVRMRITYPEAEQMPKTAGEQAAKSSGEIKSASEVMAEAECETCSNRKYQDGSDDPGVSFKTPAKIDPDVAASVVRGHEMEHVVREQAKAKREGREVVQQSVTLHTDICPECGKAYISGGTTRTTTRTDNDPEQQNVDAASKNEQTAA